MTVRTYAGGSLTSCLIPEAATHALNIASIRQPPTEKAFMPRRRGARKSAPPAAAPSATSMLTTRSMFVPKLAPRRGPICGCPDDERGKNDPAPSSSAWALRTHSPTK